MKKITLQDCLHWIMLIGLVAVAIEPHLMGDLSVKSQHIFEAVLVGLLAFNYYADLIFIQHQPPTPTPPA